jgi:hypothetical protein
MPIWGWLCGSACGGLFFLVVLLYAYALLSQRREWRYYKANATPVVGWIVQANSKLYSPEGWDSPAQVLIAFDSEPGELDESVRELAARVASLKDTDPDDPAEAAVAELVTDEGYKPFERFRLPNDFTGGREVYSFHVWVERSMLPDRHLQHPFIRCLVLVDEPKNRVVMDEYKPEDDRYRRSR